VVNFSRVGLGGTAELHLSTFPTNKMIQFLHHCVLQQCSPSVTYLAIHIIGVLNGEIHTAVISSSVL